MVAPNFRAIVTGAVMLALLTVASIAIIEFAGGTERLAEIVDDAGPWAPLVFVGVKTATYVVAPVSGGPLKVTAGAIFGFGPGVAYSLLGDVLGGSMNYWIARSLGRKAVGRLAGKKQLQKIDSLGERVGGLRALAVARLALSAVYDFVSYAAGLAKLPFAGFLLITMVGGIPPVVLTVGLGALYATNSLLLIGSYAALGVAVLVILFIWTRWRRER